MNRFNIHEKITELAFSHFLLIGWQQGAYCKIESPYNNFEKNLKLGVTFFVTSRITGVDTKKEYKMEEKVVI